MRNVVVSTAAVLLAGGLAWGEPAPGDAKEKPKEPAGKSKLEEMLEKALRDNPDVRLAAAKVEEAEAELNRARLQVVQKVAALYQGLEAQRAAVEAAKTELDRMQRLSATGGASSSDLEATQAKLMESKTKLAALEAEAAYLVGKQPQGFDEKRTQGAVDAGVQWLRTHQEDRAAFQGPDAERIRAALDKPLTMKEMEDDLVELLSIVGQHFEDDSGGLQIMVKEGLPTGRKFKVHFDRVKYGAVLEWLEDVLPNHRIVVRSYGLVIVPADKLPPGAPLLHDFWKGGKGEEKEKPKPEN
jgi:hypothetical protein